MKLEKLKNTLVNKSSTKTIIILEIAQVHDGSLGQALSYIDIAKEIGADGVKFQLHLAREESTIDEKFRVKFSKQDKNRYDYWKRTEFSLKHWKILRDKAKKNKLLFVLSIFSEKALKLANLLNVDAYKIGSGEYDSNHILKGLSAIKNKPIFLSTGMSNSNEIKKSINLIGTSKYFVLMHCTSMYPTPLKKVGLNNIEDLKKKFNCNIGYSDHTGEIHAPIISITKKVKVLEVHVTFHKKFFGPDVTSSLDIQQLENLINFNNSFFEIDNNPVTKNELSKNLYEMRSKFSKSLSLAFNEKKGTILNKNHFTLKKPGTGIKESEIKKYIGKRLNKNVSSNRLLKKSDFE
tara:strand:- start:1315 stop:2361 length:1047 start_codon:yes stop_codon:yes gene_type:complete